MAEFVTIYTTSSDIEARMIEDLLNDHDIPSRLISNITHSVFEFTIGGLAEIRIAVPIQDEVRARELLHEVLGPEFVEEEG
ncbi:MAG: putative signal transducing protein [Candidatus Bipolaricaulia bacterium]